MADLNSRAAALVIAAPNHPPTDRSATPETFAAALRHVTLRAPDGRVLLDDLDLHLPAARVGLVGRNGTGKSMLAHLLTGAVLPDAGKVVRTVSVAYVPQTIVPGPHDTVASLAGLNAVFAALDRVERGIVEAADHDMLESRWDMPAHWARSVAAAGLRPLDPHAAATTLSGGECTRVALIGALLSEAGMLILDEPTNHLDGPARDWLRAQLKRWHGTALIVSHDRALLDDMDRILELSPAGLRSYGGNYSAYRDARLAEDDAAHAALAHARNARRVAHRTRRKQHDAQLKRQAHNASAARTANLPAIVLGRHKDNAQTHAGREHTRAAAAQKQLIEAVRTAAADVNATGEVALLLPDTTVPAGRRVAELIDAVPPYPSDAPAVSLMLIGPMRVGVTGANGSGKTTLLRLLEGSLAPRAGRCDTFVPTATLDQHAHALLAPEHTLLQQLAIWECALPDGVLRSHLALLGLTAEHVSRPSGTLSGGERLKAALACTLWRKQPAQLLLLDEPTNHLDLPSLEAFESALTHFSGALVVVSHDERFLESLNLTHRLTIIGDEWAMQAVGHQR